MVKEGFFLTLFGGAGKILHFEPQTTYFIALVMIITNFIVRRMSFEMAFFGL